ncbi:acyltransferase [Polluticaenibacter yanchengensis]|uniref:DapH/DapD/GlmU-related protein n=1 Tax=Polluticaenibacter yanchengensis TaxID=3014562 RepID=A0ABT4UEI1_9BACT|nr:DapH/DapD/GlmU-related protein [Chitinophagaceae bacterium LY-5]
MEYYVHESAIIDEGCRIGKRTRIWHFCHIMSEVVIGEDCSFGQNVMIANGVTIGNNVKVQNNVSLYTGVVCGNDVFLGPSCVFTNVINPRSAVNRKNEYRQTIIEDGVTVGANATIVCGYTLGKYCFIGAGAVITKNVKPYALMVGNPARQTGWMSEAGEKLIFGQSDIAVCHISGQKYQLAAGNVRKIIAT